MSDPKHFTGLTEVTETPPAWLEEASAEAVRAYYDAGGSAVYVPFPMLTEFQKDIARAQAAAVAGVVLKHLDAVIESIEGERQSAV